MIMARTPRTSGQEDAASAGLGALNFLADLPRQQLALMTQSASALFRASESMRKVQQQAAHRASLQHQEAADKLRAGCDFNEMMAIQTELLRFNMEEAAQYWRQIAGAALRIPVELVGSAGQALDAAAPEPTLDSLQKAFEASLKSAPNGATAAH
jgi:hypothetical protein